MHTPITGLEHDAPATVQLGRGRARWAIGLLMTIYILGFIDRQVITILAEPIKRDLGLADWQVGAVSGLAFSLFYTLFGIPVARLAETSDRARIISGAIALWSLFTVACAGALNFAQLALARMGVGIGEAGCTPPALSLISDYVPREKRASTIALYMAGAPLGAVLGMVLGGLVADAWGWRTAFLVAGAPGLLVGAVALITLPEPRRSKHAADGATPLPKKETLRETLANLRTKRSYGRIIGAVTLTATVQYSTAAFLGPFYFRNFGPELAAAAAEFGLGATGFLGIALGTSLGLGGMVGAVLAGAIADRLARRNASAILLVPALAVGLSAVAFLSVLSVTSLVWSLALIAVPNALLHSFSGPAYASVQSLVAPHRRATATAVLLFCVSMVGLGLGPMLTGAASDLLVQFAGMGDAAAIRWAICGVSLAAMPAAMLFLAARKTLSADLES